MSPRPPVAPLAATADTHTPAGCTTVATCDYVEEIATQFGIALCKLKVGYEEIPSFFGVVISSLKGSFGDCVDYFQWLPLLA